jgi:hypothetical protein
MREDDERIIKKIQYIINEVVDIEQSGYDWSGPAYILIYTDKAARQIFDIMMKSGMVK